ncbi:MAG TPA: cell division FtsA domain-containing protein [Ktedonobacteraceae bacterium]|nr:cell division FtsA domain-containing protein [Ktedonobacteraceae bacterium]
MPLDANGEQRQVYTALDIGTAYAKAMIVEVQGDHGVVLGVGKHPQNYSHMSDGIVTDISGVIASCNEALIKAEKSANGTVAPLAVIGIAGELVKGGSTTVSRQRQNPAEPITPKELENLITSAQQKLLKSSKERISAETGYTNIEVRLTNTAVISVRIDGQQVSNPIGFRGRHFTLTLFSAFAPLMQLGALETVAQGLDLTLMTIVAEPYTLARCLSTNANSDSGAIFIDIGGGTTDIALVRQGGIEETRMFALGGRTFTRRLATSKGIGLKEAENLKLNYSNGAVKGREREEIAAILAPECQTWMDSIELLIEELTKGELLPPAIYLVGGGSALPDLRQRLETFPWTERLMFARQPIIRTVQPEMVANIDDPHNLLKSAQDITPMALAYHAVELQNENNILERALERVIHNMHI